MKVIIDTNVLVSAALKNKDPEAVTSSAASALAFYLFLQA